MALIVTCKDRADAIDALDHISMAIEAHKVPDWGKTKSNLYHNTKIEYKDKLGFRSTISERALYFGLVNSDDPTFGITRDIYDRYHSSFYNVLIHFSWQCYFTVEQSPICLENIDARITD
jgi:hypothetical protein